jgi:hypothetical protein
MSVDAECINCGRLLDDFDQCWSCDSGYVPEPEEEQTQAYHLTEAQSRLTLKALEVAIGDLMERSDVLAAGEVCNLLRAALGMELVSYWGDSD